MKARSEKEGWNARKDGARRRGIKKREKRYILVVGWKAGREGSREAGREAGRQVGRACMAVRLMHARLNVHSRSIKGRSKSTTS